MSTTENNINLSTAVTKAKRHGVAPVLDTKGLSRAELEALLRQYHAKVNSGSAQQFSIRFNDGSERTFYTAGEKAYADGPDLKKGQIAKGGELKSARDSGGLSVYGFGRNPISLYAGQWIELAESMPEILRVIKEKRVAIDAYIATKIGNSKQAINAAALDAQLALFTPVSETETASEEVEQAAQAASSSN